MYESKIGYAILLAFFSYKTIPFPQFPNSPILQFPLSFSMPDNLFYPEWP